MLKIDTIPISDVLELRTYKRELSGMRTKIFRGYKFVAVASDQSDGEWIYSYYTTDHAEGLFHETCAKEEGQGGEIV